MRQAGIEVVLEPIDVDKDRLWLERAGSAPARVLIFLLDLAYLKASLSKMRDNIRPLKSQEI